MSQFPSDKAPLCPLQYPGCAGSIRTRGAKSCQNCSKAQRAAQTFDSPVLAPGASVEADRVKLKTTSELVTLRKKYDAALKQIEHQSRQLDIAGALDSSIDTFTIEPVLPSGTSEATPVVVASDWHIEERVGAEVGSLNRFSLDIAHERATRFWQASLRLIQLLNKDVTIHTVVLALLGDFITNDIHGAENAEVNEIQPIHAIIEAEQMLASGIDFFLANSPYKFKIVCHSGNHARTTMTTRYASENGHSLEYFMYRHLADHYRLEPRIEFIVPESPFSFVNIYDQTIRFHHGHLIKFGGGIGGLFIPAYKAISQYQKVRRADLDVFGHFHQQKDGGSFLTNGSLIGWNSFAQAIRADYEVPKQLLFLMDKRRGRTATWPIYLT